MDGEIIKLAGANMDIDLMTPTVDIAWKQDACPWNRVESVQSHKCAIKNTSIGPYFRGIQYMDTLLCSFPIQNPLTNNI